MTTVLPYQKEPNYKQIAKVENNFNYSIASLGDIYKPYLYDKKQRQYDILSEEEMINRGLMDKTRPSSTYMRYQKAKQPQDPKLKNVNINNVDLSKGMSKNIYLNQGRTPGVLKGHKITQRQKSAINTHKKYDPNLDPAQKNRIIDVNYLHLTKRPESKKFSHVDKAYINPVQSSFSVKKIVDNNIKNHEKMMKPYVLYPDYVYVPQIPKEEIKPGIRNLSSFQKDNFESTNDKNNMLVIGEGYNPSKTNRDCHVSFYKPKENRFKRKATSTRKARNTLGKSEKFVDALDNYFLCNELKVPPKNKINVILKDYAKSLENALNDYENEISGVKKLTTDTSRFLYQNSPGKKSKLADKVIKPHGPKIYPEIDYNYQKKIQEKLSILQINLREIFDNISRLKKNKTKENVKKVSEMIKKARELTKLIAHLADDVKTAENNFKESMRISKSRSNSPNRKDKSFNNTNNSFNNTNVSVDNRNYYNTISGSNFQNVSPNNFSNSINNNLNNTSNQNNNNNNDASVSNYNNNIVSNNAQNEQTYQNYNAMQNNNMNQSYNNMTQSNVIPNNNMNQSYNNIAQSNVIPNNNMNQSYNNMTQNNTGNNINMNNNNQYQIQDLNNNLNISNSINPTQSYNNTSINPPNTNFQNTFQSTQPVNPINQTTSAPNFQMSQNTSINNNISQSVPNRYPNPPNQQNPKTNIYMQSTNFNPIIEESNEQIMSNSLNTNNINNNISTNNVNNNISTNNINNNISTNNINTNNNLNNNNVNISQNSISQNLFNIKNPSQTKTNISQSNYFLKSNNNFQDINKSAQKPKTQPKKKVLPKKNPLTKSKMIRVSLEKPEFFQNKKSAITSQDFRGTMSISTNDIKKLKNENDNRLLKSRVINDVDQTINHVPMEAEEMKIDTKNYIQDDRYSAFKVEFPVKYYYELSKELEPKENKEWYIRPHHTETFVLSDNAIPDDILNTKYISYYATAETKKEKTRQELLEELIAETRGHIENLQEEIFKKSNLDPESEKLYNKLEEVKLEAKKTFIPGYRDAKEKKQKNVFEMLKDPNQSNSYTDMFDQNDDIKQTNFAISAYGRMLEELRDKERDIVNAKRKEEYERIRPPIDKWYELKTDDFQGEMVRNKMVLNSGPEYFQKIDELQNDELY